MAADARNSGFKFLIKEMNKMQVDNDEKSKAPKKEAKSVDEKSIANVEKKPTAKKAASRGDDNIKELVKGFFQQANKPKVEKEPVDLFVGRPRKRPTKAVASEPKKPKNRRPIGKAKKSFDRRKG